MMNQTVELPLELEELNRRIDARNIAATTIYKVKRNPHQRCRRLHPCVNKHGWHNLMRKRVASAKVRKYDVPAAPRKVDLGPITFDGLPIVPWWKKAWRYIVKCLDRLLLS